MSAGKMQPTAGGKQRSSLVRVALLKDPLERSKQRKAVFGAWQTVHEDLLLQKPVQSQWIVGEEGTERSVDEWRMGDDAQEVEHLR